MAKMFFILEALAIRWSTEKLKKDGFCVPNRLFFLLNCQSFGINVCMERSIYQRRAARGFGLSNMLRLVGLRRSAVSMTTATATFCG